MAYNALNNLIDAYIYANGVQAITGQILNGLLKQMVSQLGSGYHLMGVAGPDTTPEQNDFAMAYFAATAGEYTDFGGITLAAGEVAVLLTYGNGSWEKQTIYNVPTGTADLENTANFITNAVTDLVNYYTKDEVDTILGDYYDKDEMDAALADRYTKAETDTKLGDYYRKTETYDKDEVDSIVAALSRQEYIVAWDGLSSPDVNAIPAGVTVTYSGTPYTGTLAASASTVNKIYMVWNGTAYDMYGTSQDGGYSWVPMGTTTVVLSQYATKAELEQIGREMAVSIDPGYYFEYRKRFLSGGYYGPINNYSCTSILVGTGEEYIFPSTGTNPWTYKVVQYINDGEGVELTPSWEGGEVRLTITGKFVVTFYCELFTPGDTTVFDHLVETWRLGGYDEAVIPRFDILERKSITSIGIDGGTIVASSETLDNYIPLPEFYSKNLLNLNDTDVMLGYRQYSATPQANASYNLSGYIPVTEGKTYSYSTKNTTHTTFSYCAIFDEHRTFLRFTSSERTFTAQQGDAYVRLSLRIEAWGDDNQFEEGATATLYEPFGVDFKFPRLLKPEFVMPKTVYTVKGVENSIYHKNYANYLTDDFAVSSYRNYATSAWAYLDRCFRTSNGTQTIEIRVYNKNPRKQIAYLSVQSEVGDPATDNGGINVLCIGDSFTYDGRYLQQMADICPNMNLVGMRKPAQNIQDETIRCEGRGGWTLANYRNNQYGDLTPSHMQPFSPFIQAAGYNYYGPTPFWAAIVNGTSQYGYGTNGFDDYSDWFGTDGYKKNPSVNDLMYDGSAYKYWNGSSWVALGSEPTFSFDFAKYINIWQIGAPDIVFIFLGKNDFNGGFTGWETFKQNMDALISSIHSYDSDIIVGVCTPTTADEAKNNSDNRNAWLSHMNMWEARKQMIAAYDNLAAQNVFIVDTGTVLDPDYGFVLEERLPFAFYEGNERELFATNGVHPSGAGYKQLGTCMAGFVQAKR